MLKTSKKLTKKPPYFYLEVVSRHSSNFKKHKMEGNIVFIDGKFYIQQSKINGNITPITFGNGGGGGGGLSKSAIINLINQFGGGLAPSYQATATDDITTTSTADVVATGMTLTPPAGTYLVWFSGSSESISGNDSNIVFMSIYNDGVQVASSEERNGINNSGDITSEASTSPFNCVAKVTVDGSQIIEGRWRVAFNGDGEQGLMHQRALTILKTS